MSQAPGFPGRGELVLTWSGESFGSDLVMICASEVACGEARIWSQGALEPLPETLGAKRPSVSRCRGQ